MEKNTYDDGEDLLGKGAQDGQEAMGKRLQTTRRDEGPDDAKG